MCVNFWFVFYILSNKKYLDTNNSSALLYMFKIW